VSVDYLWGDPRLISEINNRVKRHMWAVGYERVGYRVTEGTTTREIPENWPRVQVYQHYTGNFTKKTVKARAAGRPVPKPSVHEVKGGVSPIEVAEIAQIVDACFAEHVQRLREQLAHVS